MRPPIKFVEAISQGTHPEESLVILTECGDSEVARARPPFERNESTGGRLELCQPASVCPDPERTTPVLKERADMVGRQAPGYTWIVPVGGKTAGCELNPLEALDLCADPQGIAEHRSLSAGTRVAVHRRFED
jgi:hypothetical protein